MGYRNGNRNMCVNASEIASTTTALSHLPTLFHARTHVHTVSLSRCLSLSPSLHLCLNPPPLPHCLSHTPACLRNVRIEGGPSGRTRRYVRSSYSPASETTPSVYELQCQVSGIRSQGSRVRGQVSGLGSQVENFTYFASYCSTLNVAKDSLT